MHVQKSFAFAVMAVAAATIISLAGQAARAAIIIIDQEFEPASTTSGTVTTDSGATFDTVVGVYDSPLNASYGFDSRQAFTDIAKDSGAATTATGTVTLGGSLTITSRVSGGAGVGPNQTNITASWYNSSGSPVNLYGNGTPVLNDTLLVDVLSLSTSGAGSVSLKAFAVDSTFNRIEYTLPLSSNVYEIPFSDGGWVFSSGTSFDWGSAIEVGVIAQSSSSLTTPRSVSLTLGTVAAVPEPTQMVLLAGVGATWCTWRLRKFRRSKTGGNAIAC